MIIAVIGVTGTICILCFLIGAKVGQMTNDGEKIKIPTVNPVKIYRDYQDHKESEREQARLETILHNIECYDGTDYGQEDVPR